MAMFQAGGVRRLFFSQTHGGPELPAGAEKFLFFSIISVFKFVYSANWL
jgi:hypothetical protein